MERFYAVVTRCLMTNWALSNSKATGGSKYVVSAGKKRNNRGHNNRVHDRK